MYISDIFLNSVSATYMTTPPVGNPNIIPTVAPLEGSKFPERVTTRKDFQMEEKVKIEWGKLGL